METIKAVWEYLKSIFMITTSIKKLSDQINELQNQLASPAIYREELEFMKLRYDENKNLLEDAKQLAIEKKDSEKEKFIEEAINKFESYEVQIISLTEKNNNLEQSRDTLKESINRLVNILEKEREESSTAIGLRNLLSFSTATTAGFLSKKFRPPPTGLAGGLLKEYPEDEKK